MNDDVRMGFLAWFLVFLCILAAALSLSGCDNITIITDETSTPTTAPVIHTVIVTQIVTTTPEPSVLCAPSLLDTEKQP